MPCFTSVLYNLPHFSWAFTICHTLDKFLSYLPYFSFYIYIDLLYYRIHFKYGTHTIPLWQIYMVGTSQLWDRSVGQTSRSFLWRKNRGSQQTEHLGGSAVGRSGRTTSGAAMIDEHDEHQLHPRSK